nr:MAG TPA: hypothetical protein [Caudoviricetes sp.]
MSRTINSAPRASRARIYVAIVMLLLELPPALLFSN